MTKARDKHPLEANVPRVKKPYAKPSFRYERTFETMALSCGKTAGLQGQCHLVVKRS